MENASPIYLSFHLLSLMHNRLRRYWEQHKNNGDCVVREFDKIHLILFNYCLIRLKNGQTTNATGQVKAVQDNNRMMGCVPPVVFPSAIIKVTIQT